MGKIKNASKIDLSNQGLTTIPDDIYQYKNLRSLNLSGNRLKTIPREITTLSQLRRLDLSNNDINSLLANFFELEYLETLNLNGNKLKTIPKQIERFQRLKGLFLASNQLRNLPLEFGRLQKLRKLNLSDNYFSEFPDCLLSLNDLTHLWIIKTKMSKMPFRSIGTKLVKLKAIYVYTNIRSLFMDDDTIRLFSTKKNAIKLLQFLPNFKETVTIMVPFTPNKANIFISYSHKDGSYKDEVETILKSLKNIFPDLGIDSWADTRIRPGEKWLQEIQSAMDNATVAILIISRHFFASDFIMKTEVEKILVNTEKRNTKVLCLIAGTSLFKDSPLGDFQSINSPDRPLNALAQYEQDEVYNKLAKTIIDILDKNPER